MNIDYLKIFSQETMMPDTFGTISIVGNSSLLDVDRDIVDQSDLVVRFNNFGTRTGLDRTKDPLHCDILFTTFDAHSAGCNPKHVVIGIPYPFKIDRVVSLAEKWYPDSKIWMVNPYWNKQICDDLNLVSEGWAHPIPSIGFTALWHIHRIVKLGLLKRRIFYVCGFEWYFDHRTQRFQCANIEADSFPQTWNHCYPREARWVIDYMLGEDNFVFGPRQIEILGIGQCQMERKRNNI